MFILKHHFCNSKLCDELRATVAELTERLTVKTEDYDHLLTQLSNTKSQLAMANLHIQQVKYIHGLVYIAFVSYHNVDGSTVLSPICRF